MFAHRTPLWVLLVLLFSLTTIPGYTATYTCSLPWAAGDYDQNSVSGTFDFGTAFTHIDSIKIRWSGQMNSGMAIWDYPPDYDEFGFENYFWASISGHLPSSSEYWGRGASIVGSGNMPYPNARQFAMVSSFGNDWYDADRTWDCALTGKGSVSFYVARVWGFSVQPTSIVQGTTHLDEAELVLEGTAVVPEPSGLLALAGGLGALLPTLRRGVQRARI